MRRLAPMPTVRRPPPEPLRTPVTTALALGSILVTVLMFAGDSIDALVLDSRAFWDEPWRLLTSILPHGGLLHLMFNLWGLYAIGRVIEEEWGSPRTLLLTVFLAAGSGAAQYAFDAGGIGLSGVGYGHFGFWWALSRYSHRYGNILDATVTRSYVSWFFLCIVLTRFDVLHIGNVAHGVGAVLGGLVGYAVARQDRRRIVAWALAAVAFVGSVAFAARAQPPSEILRIHQLLQRDPEQAVHRLQELTARHPDAAGLWCLLARTLEQLDRLPEALAALDRALAAAPESDTQEWRDDLERRLRQRAALPTSQPAAR